MAASLITRLARLAPSRTDEQLNRIIFSLFAPPVIRFNALESKPRHSPRCCRSLSEKQMFVDFAERPKTPWFERRSNWLRRWHSTRRARGVHATTTIGDQHMRMSFVTMTNWA